MPRQITSIHSRVSIRRCKLYGQTWITLDHVLKGRFSSGESYRFQLGRGLVSGSRMCRGKLIVGSADDCHLPTKGLESHGSISIMQSGIFAVATIGQYRLYVGESHQLKERWAKMLVMFEQGKFPS